LILLGLGIFFMNHKKKQATENLLTEAEAFFNQEKWDVSLGKYMEAQQLLPKDPEIDARIAEIKEIQSEEQFRQLKLTDLENDIKDLENNMKAAAIVDSSKTESSTNNKIIYDSLAQRIVVKRGLMAYYEGNDVKAFSLLNPFFRNRSAERFFDGETWLSLGKLYWKQEDFKNQARPCWLKADSLGVGEAKLLLESPIDSIRLD